MVTQKSPITEVAPGIPLWFLVFSSRTVQNP